MTQEEKAKTYDEAKARMSRAYNDNRCTIGFMNEIFPETKESEDERIRKEIISYLKRRLKMDPSIPVAIGYWIAWLEKQGEQKPAEYTLEQVANIFLNALSNSPYNNKPVTDAQVITKELLRFLSDASSYNPNALNEQKPDTDFSDLKTWKYIVDAVWTEKEGIGQYLDAPFTEEVAKKLQKRFGNIEQKYAWSKEDDEMLNLVVARLHSHPNVEAEEYYKEWHWLNNILQKVEYSKDTWKPSEQEKAALRTAIHIMTEERNFPKLGAQLQNILDAFEGNSRVDWKPSDEQLHYLSWIANVKLGDSVVEQEVSKHLNELYTDLKKLRKE